MTYEARGTALFRYIRLSRSNFAYTVSFPSEGNFSMPRAKAAYRRFLAVSRKNTVLSMACWTFRIITADQAACLPTPTQSYFWHFTRSSLVSKVFALLRRASRVCRALWKPLLF